jgi:competence protein ComEC
MTMMLVASIAYNPLRVYNAGSQLSAAAVFGILLAQKPLKSLVKCTPLKPFGEPPEPV